MTKFARLAAVSLAAATAMTAPSVASAQTATGPGTPYNLFVPATETGTFGNNGQIGNRTFTNVFTFIVTAAGTLSADFSNSNSLNNGPADIDFSGATLTGGTIGTVNFTKLLGEPLSSTEVWGLTAPVSLGVGTYTLSVSGRSYGALSTYSGNFNIAAVPEAATWAMMILGMGMAGAALRRRQKVSVSYAA